MNDDADVPAIDFSRMVRTEQAALWLAGVLNSPLLAAKAEIADMLRDGVLESFAGCVWTSEEEDIGLAWQEGPDDGDELADVQRNVKVESWIWRWSRQWLTDQADWRWSNGRFTVVHELDPFKRVLIQHVYFKGDQLVAIVRERYGSVKAIATPLAAHQEGEVAVHIDEIEQDKALGKKPSGRHVRAAAWALVVVRLHRLKSEGKLRLVSRGDKKRLVDELVDMLKGTDYPLGTGTLGPLITKLAVEGFVEA